MFKNTFIDILIILVISSVVAFIISSIFVYGL